MKCVESCKETLHWKIRVCANTSYSHFTHEINFLFISYNYLLLGFIL